MIHILDLKFQMQFDNLNKKILNPIYAWKDTDQYHISAEMLVKKFQENYKLYDLGDKNILNAGPKIL